MQYLLQEDAREAWMDLLLAQLPALASREPVALWPRLCAAGATSVEHVAWILAVREDDEALFHE